MSARKAVTLGRRAIRAIRRAPLLTVYVLAAEAAHEARLSLEEEKANA